jgi:hypothetical protein
LEEKPNGDIEKEVEAIKSSNNYETSDAGKLEEISQETQTPENIAKSLILEIVDRVQGVENAVR